MTTVSRRQRVAAGGDLQGALDLARPGDTLILPAGATFTGPFTLPNKAGSGWITIQSSALSRIARARVTPADAPNMPKLVSPGLNQPALLTSPGAHHFRLVGIEFTKASSAAVVSDMITLGDGSQAQNSLDQVPHDLTLDRCYIHGTPDTELKRGVALNSASTEITGCCIAECKGDGYDTQAICGWNGPGPFTLVNNYLEAAGENVMFGGADPAIPSLVPSDIEIRRNHLVKPLAWRRSAWSVKNLLELKNARRVVIDGNLLENCWAQSQVGFAVQLTVRNQSGKSPWATVEDIAFTNNLVRHSGSGINLLGHDTDYPSGPCQRVRIANNLFADINAGTWGGDGRLFQVLRGVADLVIEHNTGFQTGPILSADGGSCPGFVFRGNVVPHGNYGVIGSGLGIGLPTLDALFPGWIFEGNVISGVEAAGVKIASYPAGNFFPPGADLVGCDFTALCAALSLGEAQDRGS